MFVEALIAELAVEALDVAVLHGLARLNEQVLYAMALCPTHEGPAGELRAVVGAYSLRIAAESGCLIEQARHVLTGDAEVGRDVDTLVAEVCLLED